MRPTPTPRQGEELPVAPDDDSSSSCSSANMTEGSVAVVGRGLVPLHDRSPLPRNILAEPYDFARAFPTTLAHEINSGCRKRSMHELVDQPPHSRSRRIRRCRPRPQPPMSVAQRSHPFSLPGPQTHHRHQQKRQHNRTQPRRDQQHRMITACVLLVGITICAQTGLHCPPTADAGGGYLSHPPSRNYIAYTSNSILPSSSRPLSSLPEMEPTPHNLDSGRTCGTVDGGERDYDSPASRGGTLLPLNVRGVYVAGSEIEVTVELLDVEAGGHFEFSACPVTYPEAPTEECFRRYPLEFVRDEHYGAVKDENYPSRAYLPSETAFGSGKLQRVTSPNPGPGGASMMEFSYTFRLPSDADELNTNFDTLEFGGLPNGDASGSAFAEVVAVAIQNKDRDGRALWRGPEPVSWTEETTREWSPRASRRPQHREQQHQSLQPQRQQQSQSKRQMQWVSNQLDDVTVPSLVETVLISSVSTDGNGTTTIVTLNGDVTIMEGGPKIPVSTTLTFGSKEIYGEGIPLDLLPDEVLEEVKSPPDNIGGGNMVPSNSAANAFAASLVAGGSLSSSTAGSVGNTLNSIGPVEPQAGEMITVSSNLGDDPSAPAAASVSTVITTAPNQKYVLLRWHYITARDCFPQGYNTYPWPTQLWGEWRSQWGGECTAGDIETRRTGGGYQDQYRNCAEILIVGPSTTAGLDLEAAIDSLTETPPPEPEPEPEPELYATVADSAADQSEVFAKDDKADTSGTTPVKIDVTANDVGGSLVVTGTRDGRHGTCEVTVDNQVEYTASSDGFRGKDRCAYMVCSSYSGDEKREEVCDEGWIYIEVRRGPTIVYVGFQTVDDASEADIALMMSGDTIAAVDDDAVTGIDLPVRIDVAANDKYGETSTSAVVSASRPIVTQITGAALNGDCQVVTTENRDAINLAVSGQDTHQVLYTPKSGFSGWDHCTYKICLWKSGLGNNDVCDEGRVKVKVDPDFVPPVSTKPEPASVPEEEPASTTTILKEEILDMTQEALPLGDMNILDHNLDPIANADTITVIQGGEAYIDVLSNDHDPDGDELKIYSWTSPQGGTVELVAGEMGVLKYNPENEFVGKDLFKVTICDTADRCDTSNVYIKVISEVFAVDDEATATAGSAPIIIDVTANDYSSSKEPLVITDVNNARYGQCELIGGNKVKYTPPEDGGFVGWDRCAYIVCSGDECDKGRIEIKFLPSQIDESTETRPTKPVTLVAVKAEEEAEDQMLPTTDPTVPSTETTEIILNAEKTIKRPSDEEATGPITPEVAKPTKPPKKEESQGEEQVNIEMVYAEDEVAVTSINTPIIVDVTNNDFVKGMGELTLSLTDGAENGRCRITSSNQLRYVPDRDFVGRDYCGYVICQSSMCDEGILGIKVTNEKATAKPLALKEQQPSSNGNGLVSNFVSSGGLTLGLSSNRQRARPSAAIDCQDNGGGRNLRYVPRKLPHNSACIGSSLVTTSSTPSGDFEITYTSTHRKKEGSLSTLSMPLRSALRVGKTTSQNMDKETESYIETVISIPVSADAVIMPGFPDKCFGSGPSILVSGASSGAGVHETLLQFDTLAVDSSICEDKIFSANIFLYSLSKSSQGGTFITTSDKSWSEDHVTWNNAPRSNGILLTKLSSIHAEEWYAVDVSSALILGETLSIRVVSNEEENSVARYASREHPDALLKPILNVTCLLFDDTNSDP